MAGQGGRRRRAGGGDGMGMGWPLGSGGAAGQGAATTLDAARAQWLEGSTVLGREAMCCDREAMSQGTLACHVNSSALCPPGRAGPGRASTRYELGLLYLRSCSGDGRGLPPGCLLDLGHGAFGTGTSWCQVAHLTCIYLCPLSSLRMSCTHVCTCRGRTLAWRPGCCRRCGGGWCAPRPAPTGGTSYPRSSRC